jgi:hypothetical protein
MNELQLADEHDIHALILRYASAIDLRDWALFHSCFTDSCSADYGDIGHWASANELTAVMEDMHKDMGFTLHRISNIVVTLEAQGASCRSYVDALLTSKDASENPHRAIGIYNDELLKTQTGWKIKHRVFTMVSFN